MKTIEIFAEAVKFASEASDIPSDRIFIVGEPRC